MNYILKNISIYNIVMNNILSTYGYGIVKENNEKIIEVLKKELTVSPKNFDSNKKKYFMLFTENSKRIYIPKFYGLQKFGIPNINKISKGIICSNLEFNGTLREQQIEPVNNFIEAANDPLKMGGIISVPCGFGKTIMAVYIACHFKKKTMFISHKEQK